MLSSYIDFFPHHDEERLADESGYLVWTYRMREAFILCALLDVVDGQLKEPSDAAERTAWLQTNATALALIRCCVKCELVVKIAHLPTAHAVWELLAAEFGSRPMVDWCRRLIGHMPSGGDMSAHINEHREATRYLAMAGIDIPDWCSAARILLSTLSSDPEDLDYWDHFIKGVRINKATTLSSIRRYSGRNAAEP